jgi:hypothetical protein
MAGTDLVYYLGVPEPSWLHHGDGVPKFVSAARFDRYVTGAEKWPTRSASTYAIDSGAYIALTGSNKTVPWFDDPDVYGGKILRFIDNTGYPPDFAAIQDVPCEPAAQRATGLTVRDHQELTCDSFDWLTREFPMVPWIPVLQGEKPGEHVDHAHMYADRGVDLAGCHRVGVGSICRLTELDGVVQRITELEELAAQGLKMHGFGIKTDALPLIGHVLASADSMAWSAHVRHNGRRNPIKLPGCTHVGDCRNCYRYAVHWREQVLASLTPREEATMSMFEPKPGTLWSEARNIDTANYRNVRWFIVVDVDVDQDTVTTVDVDRDLWVKDRPTRPWRLDPPVDVTAGPFKRIARDKLRNKNFVLMADAEQVGAVFPSRERIIMATALKTPVGQGDLLAGLLDLTALVADNAAKKPTPAKRPAPRPRGAKKADPVVIPDGRMDLLALLAAAVADQATVADPEPPVGPLPLADVAWGTYGKISAGWASDGSRASTLVGYLVDTARVYTGGLMGRSKDKTRVGDSLLLCNLETRADGGSTSIYAPPGATFTVLDPPADHELHATMRLSRRLPFADVRPGDVFYLWDERDNGRTLKHRGGRNVADLRTRYHVQDVPAPAGGDGQFDVQVLVDGGGPIVAMTRPGQLWVDIVDPRDEPWNDGVTGEQPNPFVAARRELTGRLGTEVLVGQDGMVVVAGSADGVAAISEVVGCAYRWWFEDEGRHFFRPVADDRDGPVLGRVGAAGDGYDEVRQVLADSAIEHGQLRLPRVELDKPVWEKLHAVMRGMGATGGSRKNQPYDVKVSQRPDLWAFIAGGPAPKHERTTVGWVRTPDKLALDD